MVESRNVKTSILSRVTSIGTLLGVLAASPAIVLTGCSFEAAVDTRAQVSCDNNIECPETMKCFRTSGTCIPAGTECLISSETDEFLVPVGDGTLCTSGLCIGGACVSPTCGDGFVSQSEECDDVERRLTGSCTPECRWNVCGDGFIHISVEECDDANESDGDGCDNDCSLTRCGNGILTEGESCDDGNGLDGDGCDRNCTLTACGNGVLTAGESCDDGNMQNGDGCDQNCRPTGCGNGVVALDEECDDGNDIDSDSCTNDCRNPRCGDGILHAGEACDDGNEIDGDACRADCLPNVCGDGFLNPTVEECDDGNASNNDACLTSCEKNRCGDGFRNPALEQCDDGNLEDTDECLRNCAFNVCGDGYLNPASETCDDGNLLPGDACTALCTVNICGDGDLNLSLENCDDGNRISGDGCRSDCKKVEVCGDGLVDTGEDCDDANSNPRDGCMDCRNQTWTGEWLVSGRRRSVPPETFELSMPGDVLVDASGNVIFSDSGTRQVFRLRPSGDMQIVTGLGFAAASSDSPARALRSGLGKPRGLALAPNGDLLIADSDSNRVRRINQNGLVSTVAGRREAADPPLLGAAVEGISATEMDLNRPYDVAVDALGRIYIAEYWEGLVRVVGLDGDINTFAGGGAEALTPSNSGQLAARDADLSQVAAVAVDGNGRVFVAEPYAHRVLSVEPDGTIAIVAGDGNRGFAGDGGDARAAQLAGPFGLHVDDNDRLWIADQFNHRIRRVDFFGDDSSIITTVVGGGQREISSGLPALEAKIESPRGLFVTPEGRLWFTEMGGHRVSEMSVDGTLFPRAGTGRWAAPMDGQSGLSADIVTVFGLALNDDGGLYFGDAGRSLIFEVLSDQSIRRVAGTYFNGWNLENSALKSPLDAPRGMSFASDGSLYFADLQNHCVRRVRWLDGESVLEGAVGRCDFDEGAFAGDGELAINARLRVPHDVFVERKASGDVLWIADTGNHAIRRVPINQNGNPDVIQTYVGGPGATTTEVDTPRSVYELRLPGGVIVDDAGRVYISEYRAHRVVRVGADDRVQLIAGTGVAGVGEESVLATQSELGGPVGLALSSAGELYIAEFDNARIRVVHEPGAPGATIETFAGTGELGSNGDEGLATEAALTPLGLRFAPDGDLYIADEDRIRRIEMEGDQQGIIHTVAGGLYFQNSFGPSMDVILLDSMQLERVGPYLLSSSGDTGYVHGFHLESGLAAPMVGYPGAAVSVRNQARFSAPLNIATGMYFDPESSRLFVTDGGRPGDPASNFSGLQIVYIPQDEDGTLMPPQTWTQETKRFSRGTFSQAVYDLDLTASLPSELPPIAVSAGQSVRILLKEQAPVPGSTFVLRAQLDVPPTALRFDCTTTTDVVDEGCLLQVPEGVTTLYVNVEGNTAAAVQVQVDVDEEEPWMNLWGITAANDPEYLTVADYGAHCIRHIKKDGTPAGEIYGVCGEPGQALGLLRYPTDVLLSPFSDALYIADFANNRVLRVAPTGETSLVVGDGTPSSSGAGRPADRFSVHYPSSLAMDEWGNLYVASKTALRIIANVDGDLDADGDDLALNVIDASHPLLQGAGSPDCMRALTLDEQGNLFASDRCEGFILRLMPTTAP